MSNSLFGDLLGAGMNVMAGNYVGAAGDLLSGVQSAMNSGSSTDQVMQQLEQGLQQFSPQQLQQLLSALSGGNSQGPGQTGGSTGYGGGPSGYEGYPGMAPEGSMNQNQGQGLLNQALHDTLKHKRHAEGAGGA